jgi:hypothetical protein
MLSCSCGGSNFSRVTMSLPLRKCTYHPDNRQNHCFHNYPTARTGPLCVSASRNLRNIMLVANEGERKSKSRDMTWRIS